MGTNYIAPIWRMPENTNKDKLSNYSIEFDGGTSSQAINCGTGDDVNITGPISISVWFNTNDLSSSRGIVCKNDNNISKIYAQYLLEILNGSLRWRAGKNDVSYTIQANQWYHAVGTYDGSNITLYVNGVQVATASASSTSYSSAQPMYIGYRLAQSYFGGQIAQVCIFDYALTDGTGGTTDQIGYLYNLNNPMAITGGEPVAYYPLGDNSNPNANAGYPNISVGADSVFDFIPLDYIDLGDPDSLSFGDSVSDSPFTMSAWIKTNYNGDAIISKWGASPAGYEWLFYIVGNVIRLALYDVNTSNYQRRDGVTIVNTGEWVHVLTTYDGRGGLGTSANTANQGIKIYINGVEESSYTDSFAGNYVAMHNTIRPVEIGTYSTSSASAFNGEMTNVQIWKTDLTAPEVSTVYNNGQPLMTGTQPQENNLQAWYKLNQSANWEADTVGNWQIPDAVSAYPQSFKFNEIQDYIEGDLNLDGEKVHAVSFWVKNKQASGIGYVLSTRSGSYGPGFNFIIRSSDNNGNIYSNVRDTPTTTQSNVSNYQSALRIPQDDNWHHVIFTHDITTGQLKAYIDGVYKYQRLPVSRTDSNTINPLKISHFQSTQDFGGYVSNVMVWEDVVLTDGGVALNDVAGGEIAQVYNNGVPITSASVQPDKLKGWYKLDNNELFDGTNWSVENQKYPANYESALYFTGGAGNEHLETPSNSDLLMSGSHTFSAWVYVNSAQVDAINYIFDKGGGGLDYALGFSTNTLRLIYYNYYDSGGPSGKNKIISLDTSWKTKYENGWHHIVVSVDQPSLTVTLVTDGTEISTHSLPADYVKPDQGGGILNIMSWNGTTASLAGFISNLAFYNGTALTTAQALTLYNNGTPEDNISFSPTSWWKIDNTSTGLLDNAGTANLTNTGGVELSTFVSSTAGVSVDMTEQNLVNNNVSVLNGESSGMNTTNLVQSNLTRTQPYSNYSFHFDGTQYIDIPDSDLLSFGNGTNDSPFSISAWIKKPLNANEAIISKFGNTGTSGYEWLLWAVLPSPHRIRFAVYDNSNAIYQFREGNTSIDTGEWVHVVATYDGRGGNGTIGNTANQGMKIYINGTEESSYTDGNNPSGSGYVAMHNTTRNVQIGATNNSNQWDGQISNTAVFDKELTNQEVLKIYNNGVPQDLQTASSFSNNLVAWWPMDQRSSYYDGTNWVARDLENGNDGTGVNTGNVDDLVGNAPGSDANGSGNNLTIADLKGDMSDSDKNAYSINMADYADGVTNPANSGRSTDTP